jgi:methylated-DNA-[protein]-cysteine S-methyltransferase
MLYDSPIGLLRIRTTDVGIAGISLPGMEHGVLSQTNSNPVVGELCRYALNAYFAKQWDQYTQIRARIPFDLEGATPFQKQVWAALFALPRITLSYGDLAMAMGRQGAEQAIGAACHRNPVPILIPCHRIVGSHGIGGYAGGIEAKQWLLNHEKAPTPTRHATVRPFYPLP